MIPLLNGIVDNRVSIIRNNQIINLHSIESIIKTFIEKVEPVAVHKIDLHRREIEKLHPNLPLNTQRVITLDYKYVLEASEYFNKYNFEMVLMNNPSNVQFEQLLHALNDPLDPIGVENINKVQQTIELICIHKPQIDNSLIKHIVHAWTIIYKWNKFYGNKYDSTYRVNIMENNIRQIKLLLDNYCPVFQNHQLDEILKEIITIWSDCLNDQYASASIYIFNKYKQYLKDRHMEFYIKHIIDRFASIKHYIKPNTLKDLLYNHGDVIPTETMRSVESRLLCYFNNNDNALKLAKMINTYISTGILENKTRTSELLNNIVKLKQRCSLPNDFILLYDNMQIDLLTPDPFTLDRFMSLEKGQNVLSPEEIKSRNYCALMIGKNNLINIYIIVDKDNVTKLIHNKSKYPFYNGFRPITYTDILPKNKFISFLTHVLKHKHEPSPADIANWLGDTNSLYIL